MLKEHEKEKLKAYITYPETDEIKSILLTERMKKTQKLVLSSGKVYHSRHNLPKEILDDMIKKGKAEVIQTQKVVYEGKSKLFNVPYSQSRTLFISGDKYIQVRILSNTVEDLIEGVSLIKKNMLKYGVREKVCVWSQIGHLGKKIPDFLAELNESVQTVMPDFDQAELEKRKGLEQVTARLETQTGTPI
jgi:hypothetical protein